MTLYDKGHADRTILALDYAPAAAIERLARTLEAVVMEYTGGYNTMPRSRVKRELLEEGLAAVAAYRTVLAPAINERVHMEHCPFSERANV